MTQLTSINRRRFLEQTALVGATVAVGTQAVGVADAEPPAKKIKVRVIG